MSRFITIEGPDGAGKTTLIQGLITRLEQELRVPYLLTREPGGEVIAEKIRDLILDPAHTNLDPRAEALLYAASRRQHLMHKVLPALDEGTVVICDRFVDSSLAYQGYGRELGAEAIWDINTFAIDGHLPDLTIYLDLSAEEGIHRIQSTRHNEQNRLDQEAIDFHQRVVKGYGVVREQFPERIHAIDATQSPEAMQDAAFKLIKTRFPELF